MTEREWLTADNPKPMLKELQGRKANRKAAGRRKLVLFGCACCRRISHLMTDRGHRWLEAAEKAADGERVKIESMGAIDNCDPRSQADCSAHFLHSSNVMIAAACGAERALVWELRRQAKEAGTRSDAAERQLYPREKAVQAGLLREIFGNPFQPPPPRTFPAHAVGLAQSCYAAFPEVSVDFLILADALEELGEEAAAEHCPEKEHVKGCHMLDWILGKS
jgi:hypothetical protein